MLYEDLVYFCLKFISWIRKTAENIGFELLLRYHRERVNQGGNPRKRRGYYMNGLRQLS